MVPLLPFKYKIFGIIAVATAVILSIVYFIFELKIEVPVFAVVSSYLEPRFFTSFTTNVIEEIILLLFIVGFSLIVFTKTKHEKLWIVNIRIKSAGYTIIAYLIWLLITTLFIFGSAYVTSLIINIVLPFILYISIFYSLYYKTYKRRRIKILQQKLFNSQARES